MKTLIIYQSIHHGNTEKIAKVIADVLKADLVKPNELDIEKMKKYDLIGFGSGIYAWRHHRSLLKLVDELPKLNKKAFIFSTAGKPSVKNHKSLRKKLQNKGFTVVNDFSCPGFDSFGPFKLFGGFHKGRPNEEDFKKAKEFAKELKNFQ
ncbi:MAG: flavodoxin family protein [Candidatus Woesearchaeota archaeon]